VLSPYACQLLGTDTGAIGPGQHGSTVEYTVSQDRQETIQVVLDSKLLSATEAAARRTKLNRSALIRDAPRAHLKNLAIRERELHDRKDTRPARATQKTGPEE